jgi:hypothetical protein
MSEQWVTIAEAAATMKCHPRTIERRAAAGKLESRRNDDGQVQVFIDLPDPAQPAQPHPESVPPEAFETVREMADRQVDIAAGSASALVRAAQEQAMRSEHQMDLARQESFRYRRETQMALALVAVMLLFVIVAVGWCTHTITEARDRVTAAELVAKNASTELAHKSDQLASANDRLAATSDKLAAATIAQAKAEGELVAYKEGVTTVEQQTRPATRPTNPFTRIAQAFIGD